MNQQNLSAADAERGSDSTHSALQSRAGYLDFLPTVITNTLLVIVTFNVYIFWAKTNVRRYLWGTTLLAHEPFQYSGNGRELAKGFAAAVVGFLLLFGYPALIVLNTTDVDPEALVIPDIGLVGSLIVGALVPVSLSFIGFIVWLAPEIETSTPSATLSFIVLWLGIVFLMTLSRFLTYRYLFRHTRWHHSNGEISGSPFGYTFKMLLPELSVGLSLGWSGPWRLMRRFQLLLNSSIFVGLNLRFEGGSKKLYGPFAITWFSIIILCVVQYLLSSSIQPEDAFFVLNVIVIGVVFFGGIVVAMTCYNRKLFAHVAESISLGDTRLCFTGTRTGLAKLYATNLLMNLLSAGFSYYYSRMRIARFIIRHLEVQGEVLPVDPPRRNQELPDRLGEGAEILLAGSYF